MAFWRNAVGKAVFTAHSKMPKKSKKSKKKNADGMEMETEEEGGADDIFQANLNKQE